MRPSFLLFLAACHDPESPPPEESTPDPPSDPPSDDADDTSAPTTEPTGTGPPPSNVLLVMFDDVSVFDVGTYGLDPAAPPTPTLDGLAAEGVTFRHAWGTPLCSPSRAALLTGRYPGRTGIGYTTVPSRPGPSLSTDETTLAEILAGAPDPMDTSVVGKWNLTSSEHPDPYQAPAEHGFDWFVGTVGNIGEPLLYGEPFPNGDTYYHWGKNDNGTPVESTVYATTDNANDAIDRIGAMHEPWFLYLPFNAPHDPWDAPPPELVPGIPDTATDAEKARAMLQAADIELGRVLDAMDPDLRARTTIIVLGDNGTDPYMLPDPPETWKFSVYERGVNVPLIVSGAAVTAPGTTSEALVSIVDLFPTIAEIAGVDLSGLGVPLDGVSLGPILRDPTATVRDWVFTQAFYPNDDPTEWTMAIRDDRYKLVLRQAWRYASRPTATELYDLQGVDLEGTDLADDPALAPVRERLSAAVSDLLLSFENDPLRNRP